MEVGEKYQVKCSNLEQSLGELDIFVDESVNGTIFHKPSFLNYHRTGKFDYKFLKIYYKNTLLAFLPCVFQDDTLKSNSGASFGGICYKELSFQRLHEIHKVIKKWATNNKFNKITFTISPIIYSNKLSQDQDFVLLYNNYQVKESLFSSVIDLSYFLENKELESFSKSGIRAIKKSKRENVVIKKSNEFESYYHILEENKKKFGTSPAHTLDELNKIKSIFPDKIVLLSAFINNEMIAGILCFEGNENVLLAFYIASIEQYNCLRPVNYLLYELCKYSVRNNYKYIDLGVSMNTKHDNPIEPSWSLISFKEHTGSKGFLRQTYEWKY